jgi:IS30 family transposase
VHTDVHVATVMRELNTRPRKTLGYDTPASRFHIEIRKPPGASTEAVGALAG